MFKRVALAVVLLATAVPSAGAATNDALYPASSGQSVAPGPVQLDPAKKAWFDRAVSDILEGHQTGSATTDAPVQ